MLNKDQEKALKEITNWWNGPRMYHILDGPGGTGKTFLLDMLLQNLKDIHPILLAPTHEALKQMREKIKGDYEYRTVHSSLGIAPTVNEANLKFEQLKLPSLWNYVNLAIIDEASMIPDFMIDLLLETGTRILYVGHKSQLPPVNVNRKSNDPCISPVFEKGYQTSSLSIPMRNTGKLWEFNNHLEWMIYNRDRFVPKDFDVSKKFLREYMQENTEDFLSGNTKVCLWMNDSVDRYNNKIRKRIFGENPYKYLEKDLIILTSPCTQVDDLEFHDEYSLEKGYFNKEDRNVLYSNSKAVVRDCKEVLIRINKKLEIACYKITCLCDGKEIHLYEAKDEKDIEQVSLHYEHLAWSMKSKEAKNKMYQKKHFFVSLFAKIKHYYAATAHRLQGASIKNVVVIDSDIARNQNIVELKKARYVACSRSVDNLYFYRGL